MKRMLIINNAGIGNGIIVLPVLAALERRFPGLQYYHVDNPVLDIADLVHLAGMKELAGRPPVHWRRFEPDVRRDLLGFIEEKDIEILVNLRKEAAEVDRNYFEFKADVEERGVECWDLHELEGENLFKYIGLQINDVFALHGVNLDIDWNWLSIKGEKGDCPHGTVPFIPNRKDAKSKPEIRRTVIRGTDPWGQSLLLPTIGFLYAASRPVKRWAPSKWVEFTRELLARTDCRIELMPGATDDELESARELMAGLESKSNTVAFIPGLSMKDKIERIRNLDMLVTHDTFGVHTAWAAGVPLVAINTATDGRIWSPPDSKRSIHVQSRYAMECSRMKDDGTCDAFFDETICRHECGEDITPGRVLKALISILSY
ncbi:glycosyltransferase family 9 protein [Candidatus Hydrogenedentota bacterium]